MFANTATKSSNNHCKDNRKCDPKPSPLLAERLMILGKRQCRKHLSMEEFVPHNRIFTFPLTSSLKMPILMTAENLLKIWKIISIKKLSSSGLLVGLSNTIITCHRHCVFMKSGTFLFSSKQMAHMCGENQVRGQRLCLDGPQLQYF